ncbi:hypothetical protein SLE2022_146200 [Rubroshorea leprosula]
MRRGSHHEEGDEQHSSNTLPKDDEARRSEQSDGSGVGKTWFLVSYITPAQMLVVINFILQIPLAVLGQLNSNPKLLYSFILMLLSLASLLLCIIELKYRSKGETVTQRMRRGEQPLLHSPSPTNSKPFSRADTVGLLSTIFQSVFTTVNCARLVQHSKKQIQISAWPIFFASVLLYSAFQRNRTQTDQPHHVQLHSIIIHKPTSEYQESFTSLQDHSKATRWRYLLGLKAFAIVSFILEIPSAIFDQLSSEPKSRYALILMFLSFVSLFLCMVELFHKRKTGRVTWSFWDKVGLICAVVQPILSTVNYALVRQQRGQVQISVLPLVFTLALSCSEVWESPNMTGSEGNIDEEEQVSFIDRRQGVTEVSTLKKESESTASEEGKSGLTNQSQLSVNEEVFPKKEKSVVKDDNKMAPKAKDSREPLSMDTFEDYSAILKRHKISLAELDEDRKKLLTRIASFLDCLNWPSAKNKKKKELMQEPTRRKTDTILRRRRKSGR